LQAVANSEHNPIQRAWLASPSAVTRMKIVVAKMVIIVCAVGINVGAACAGSARVRVCGQPCARAMRRRLHAAQRPQLHARP